MAKILIHLYIMSNNFMGVGAYCVNVLGFGSTSSEEIKFEALYNK